MNLLRGWLFYIVLSFSILVLAVCVLCTTPFASVKWRYEAICRPWAKFVLALLRVICGIRLEMKGMENLPPADTQAVVLMKHQSAWDPFWLGAYLPAPACFIYKRSINWIPVLGWVVCAMDMLAIDRSKGRSAFEAFMKKGPVKLREGFWISLFPEGTRVPPGERVRYKTGGARFACPERDAHRARLPQCRPLLAQELHRQATRHDHRERRPRHRDEGQGSA